MGKRITGEILKRFAALNLLVVVPLVLVAPLFAPDILDVEMRTDHATSFRCGGEKLERMRRFCSSAEFQHVRTFFEDPCDPAKLHFGFDGSAAKIQVKSVSILRGFGLFRSVLPSEGLIRGYVTNGLSAQLLDSGVIEIDVPSGFVHFDPNQDAQSSWSGCWPNVTMSTLPYLIAFEMALLLLSLLLLRVRTDSPMRLTVLQSMILALHAAVFCCVIVPLQTLIANQADFSFTIGAFVMDAVICAVVAFVVVWLLLMVSERMMGGILLALLLFFLVFEYFETGPFGNLLPPLDGSNIMFRIPLGMKLDLVVAGILAISLFVGYHWTRRYFHWISLAFLALALLSLFDVRKREGLMAKAQGAVETGFCSINDVLNSIRYSARRNVLFVIVDSVRGDMAMDAIRSDDELKRKFAGFVAYDNNVSMGYYTATGLPGLMTGQYRDGKMSKVEYASLIHATNSFYRAYSDAGIETYSANSLSRVGYASRIVPLTKGAEINRNAYLSRLDALPYMNLKEILVLRMMPFALKYETITLILSSIQMTQNRGSELMTYPILKDAEVSAEAENVFLLVHTNGAHPPMDIDKDGNLLPVPRDNYECGVGKTHFTLKCVADLLDAWRRKGIFDESMIVVTTDHGNRVAPTRLVGGDEFPGGGNALLWVKPFRSTNNFEVTTIPTCHSRVHDLMVASVAKDLKRAEIDKLLREEVRRFCNYDADWIIDANGKVKDIEKVDRDE